MLNPSVSFHSLPHADGSATYSNAGYQIIAAVNGPIEAQRRDELPEEAFIEINLRPASGSGGTHERHLETLIHSTLRPVILTHAHPRSLIQLTLQILSVPSYSSAPTAAPMPQTASHIPSLPHLLHAALLALLSANIPLSTTYTCALVAVMSGRDGETTGLVVDPDGKTIKEASSVHVFAYTADGELLLAESEGMFDVEDWEKASAMAEQRCRGEKEGGTEGDTDEMADTEGRGGLQEWLRTVVADDVRAAGRWKGNL